MCAVEMSQLQVTGTRNPRLIMVVTLESSIIWQKPVLTYAIGVLVLMALEILPVSNII